MQLKKLIELFSSQVPDFAKWIMYLEYSDQLSHIALKTLELLGSQNQNKILSYKNDEYSFEIRNRTLTIKQQARGEILQQKEDTVSCNFTLEDIEKLERFEQKLNQQHQESITKN